MTREEALQILDTIPTISEQVDALEMAIQALSQEPCDDAVSRQAVLQAVSEGCFELRGVYGRCEELINALPSVTQKSGKWILLDECANSGYYCSNCQKKLVKEGWSQTVKKIKYCPNCGAKMKSEVKQ